MARLHLFGSIEKLEVQQLSILATPYNLKKDFYIINMVAMPPPGNQNLRGISYR